MKPILKIGSRESELAIRQAQLLQESLHMQGIQTELVTMKTTGDVIQHRTLDEIGGKGLFVKELDAALRCGEVDLTVHSLKDMPMETQEDLPILATSRRADARDVLVLPKEASHDTEAKPIGCSSKRRQLQLHQMFPNEQVSPVRGNVLTRLQKLDRGEYRALVLAAAGLHRLGLSQRISRYFTTKEILPAAGQAIVVVQGRADFNADVLAAFQDDDAWDCMRAERAFVRELDGGCSSPVAAYAQVHNKMLTLTGLYISEDGSIMRRGTRSGSRSAAKSIGIELAYALRAGEVCK